MQTSFELTPKQAEYIRNSDHRWNVACGAVRSGKSFCQVAWCIPYRLMERKDKRGLKVILGATRENIERNILQPMRDIYGNSVATDINSKNFAKILGEKVYCIGADNVRQVAKIRGSEIAYCAIDEATDVNQEVFEMLKSRLSLPWSCCDITTNPASPNHWFKDFLDSKEHGVDIYEQDYTIYDNPFLPEDYIEALEAEYAGTIWYDRYILGKWTLAEGLIFPNYTKAIYNEDMEEDTEKYVISLDYGTSNPFAAMLWEKHGDIWYAPTELYYSGRDCGMQKTDGQYLEMLKSWAEEWIPNFGNIDPITVIVDPSAASFIALLRQDENFKARSANNDVINGIRDVNTVIHTGKIKINSRCNNWQKEAGSYVWDESSTEDRPVKENDHLMDATRYFVRTMKIARNKREYISIFGG